MKSQARVVVIGGGVVGVSTLYHLAKKGWSDVVLVERKELTSGSTWHAAGLLPLFNMSYSVGQIHKYSVALYKTLEAETGQNVGFSVCSNIRLARTKDRWDEFMYYAGVARTIGVNVNILTPDAAEGDLAALRDRRHPRRDPASRRRLHPARRPDAGAGARRAQPRRGDLSQHDGHRHRAEAVRRMAGEDRQGRHRLRARRLRHRQFRAPHRRDGRARHAGHPGRAPVYRHRGASGDPGAPAPGPAGDGRAARGGFLLVHARGGGRPAARPLREGRAGLLCRRAVGGQRIRALPGGSRAADAAYRDGDRARAGLRRGRHQEGL